MPAPHTPRAAHPAQRIFLALWPDDGVRRRIAAHVQRWTFDARSRRYAPADWHVTLHFLGRVPASRVPEIADGVRLHVEPFALVLDRPQIWPAGLAVIGASQLPAPLRDLHLQLARVLQDLHQTVDTRTYRPHLTLARRAGNAIAPTEPSPVVWPVRSFALVASTGNVGARYALLRQYP